MPSSGCTAVWPPSAAPMAQGLPGSPVLVSRLLLGPLRKAEADRVNGRQIERHRTPWRRRNAAVPRSRRRCRDVRGSGWWSAGSISYQAVKRASGGSTTHGKLPLVGRWRDRSGDTAPWPGQTLVHVPRPPALPQMHCRRVVRPNPRARRRSPPVCPGRCRLIRSPPVREGHRDVRRLRRGGRSPGASERTSPPSTAPCRGNGRSLRHRKAPRASGRCPASPWAGHASCFRFPAGKAGRIPRRRGRRRRHRLRRRPPLLPPVLSGNRPPLTSGATFSMTAPAAASACPGHLHGSLRDRPFAEPGAACRLPMSLGDRKQTITLRGGNGASWIRSGWIHRSGRTAMGAVRAPAPPTAALAAASVHLRRRCSGPPATSRPGGPRSGNPPGASA